MLTIPCTGSSSGSPLERTLHSVNSVLVFWFFACLITGPKNSHATTALLALSLVTLPATLRIVPRIWNQAAPWLVGLSVYCAYQIAYLKAAGLPLKTIRELQEEAYVIVGRPDPLPFKDRVVAIMEARDGTILDVVRQIDPLD